jgi:DNA-binding response OmpR family regulator
MKRILIIEDDLSILKGLEDSLEREHYEVESVTDGEKGYKVALGKKFDLILLDLMLPSKNGMDICRDLRAENIRTPIIMLTSKNEEIDKVLGLEFGADDYVTKPFSLRELQARIKAVLRRFEQGTSKSDTFSFGDIVVDFIKLETTKSGKPLELSSREYEILKLFINHQGELVTRDMLLDEVWGYDFYPTTRTVDNYILNLRKKIEIDPANPEYIITVHKAGYKFKI